MLLCAGPPVVRLCAIVHPARSRLGDTSIALLLANIEGNDRLIIGEQSGQTCQPGNDQWQISSIALAQEFCHKQKSKAAPKEPIRRHSHLVTVIIRGRSPRTLHFASCPQLLYSKRKADGGSHGHVDDPP